MAAALLPMTANAESEVSYVENGDGTYTLSGLGVKIYEDDEIIGEINDLVFDTNLKTVNGGFLQYVEGTHRVEYSVTEGIYKFKYKGNYADYEYYGTEIEKFEKNEVVKAYTEFNNSVIVSVEIPVFNELVVFDGEIGRNICVQNYIKNNYQIDVAEYGTPVVFEGLTPVSTYKIELEWMGVPVVYLDKDISVSMNLNGIDPSKNNYYAVYYDGADETDKELLKVKDGVMQWKTSEPGIFTIASKKAVIIATSKEGVMITEDSVRFIDPEDDEENGEKFRRLDCSSTNVILNTENTEIIVEGFMKWAALDAERDNVLPEEYIIQLGWNDGSENQRPDDLEIVINQEAAKAIETIEKNGGKVLITMGTKKFGTFFYRNITGPTSLGFKIHDYLENTHWDFYGGGYDFYFMEFPYSEPGAVQFLYLKDKNGNMGIKDLRQMSDDKYHDISVGTEKDPLRIEFGGLHYLVPKDSNKTNLITMTSSATEEQLKEVMIGTAKTVEGSVKAVLENEKEQVINATVFSTVSNQEKITAVEVEHGGIQYTIDKSDIKNTDVSMTVGAEENTENAQQVLGETALFAIDFAHSGDLPGNTKVTVPVELGDGTYVWSYLNDAGELVESQNVTVKDGQVQAVINHCSTYVVTKGNVSGGGEAGAAKPESSTSKKEESIIAKMESTGKHVTVDSLSNSVIEDGKNKLETLIGDSARKYRLALAVDLSAELEGRTDVRIQVDGVTANDAVIILNKGKDGWKSVPNFAGNGFVIGKFDHFSPVLIFVDKDGELEAAATIIESASVATVPTTTAPAPTGDSANVVIFGFTMICAAAAIFAIKNRLNSN